MTRLLALLLCLLAGPALAQNLTCPTRPPGDQSNACASTAFVQTAVPLAAITSLTGPITATGPGAAATTIGAGVVTSSNLASGAAATNVGTLGGTLGGTLPSPSLAGQSSATANQIPVFPGSSGVVTPTSATTWFDNAYCNTVGFLIVRFTGAWTCSKFVAANPVWWGADPTGASDSTSALNGALSASNVVEFPAGKFKFLSAITYNLPAGINSVTVKGQGQDVTILTWPNASGGMTFNYAGISSSVHLRDLSFTTGTTAGGTAVTLTLASSVANPAVFAQSDFYRVTFRGDDGYAVTDYWSTDVAVANVSNVNWEGVAMYGASTPNGNGITLVGLPGSSTYGVQYNVAKSTFESLNQGITYGSFVQGVTVDQCNFTGSNQGIISLSSQTGTLAQLAVTNSQFGITANSAGLVTLTPIVETQIANNLFIALGSNATAINLSQNAHFTITGNEITSSTVTGTGGILIGTSGGGSRGNITGNDIFGFGTGISLQSGAININVQSNTLTGNTTSINNASASTGMFIAGNPGYNPVGPAAITVTASPFTYTAGASPETVYIWNGVVSSVTFDKNGGALGTVANVQTNSSYDLGPFEQLKVTYSALPNMNKMVH
jgi:hypothetical protein